MAKTPPWLCDTDAYLADTGHLRGATQHGAYLLILIALWRSKDGWIRGDDASLAATAHMTLDKWRRVAPVIRPFLKQRADGWITQDRARREKLGKTYPSQNPSRNPGSPSNRLKNIEPTIASAESDSLFILDSENLPKGKKERVIGTLLTEGWTPRDEERLYGRTVLHLTDVDIDRAAEQMRRWALSNAHRKVARKSNWPMTFRNWLDRYAVEQKPNGGKNDGRTNGSAAAAAARLADGLRSGQVTIPPKPVAPHLLRRESEAPLRLIPPGPSGRS